MKRLLRFAAAAFIFGAMLGGPLMVAANPVAPSAAAACDDRVIGIPPWYRGLTEGNKCNIKSPDAVGGIQQFITILALNIIEIIMVIIGYIAVFFILYGGFQFVANNGSADTVSKATKTILNAVIGLAISLSAVAILNFTFGAVGVEGGRPALSGNELIQSILNTAYFIGGIIAVIVIIIAGLTYATSGGDSSKITRAKNQILFSVIGIVLILSAFAISNFIIERF